MKLTIVAVCVMTLSGCASAFVLPAGRVGTAVPTARSKSELMASGKYDDKVWDDDAKKDILSQYDSSKPWTEQNFDPFKKDERGNSCDASGYYPGETRYKDPIRPQVSFEEYLKQRAEKDGK